MKKATLLAAALFLTGMLFSTQVMAQGRIDLNSAKSAQTCANVNDEGFTATFSFGSIEAEEVSTEKGVFSYITMDNTYPTGMVGEPTIPAANKLLAIPYGASELTVKVNSYSTSVYSLADFGINRLYPQQPLLRKDQKPSDIPFEYNEEAYAVRGFVERPIAEVKIQGTMRGIQIGALTVNPVQYDAATNTIRVYNDIEVEVSYGQYDKAAAYNEFARTFSPYFAGIYKTMFNWRDDVYDQHPDLWQNPVKMLVIANRMFEDTMQEWLAWKTTKGFYVDVNYTDEIGNNASAIQTFIQNKYNEDAPSFLMIVGDKDQVPASATGNQTHCVTDLYYMSTDGDEFPEIFHCRFPAETTAQLANMLEKALEYEQYTMPDPSYLSNVLLIAGEDSSGWGVQVGRPAIWYGSHYYYNTDHGFNNVYEYSQGTYGGCYSNLNTGVGFANYTAHGSNTSWAGPSLTVSDVNNLTNEHKYFLAMGNCCEAADWGINGTCFGEAMVRAEKKAAYAYIGSCPSTYWLNDYYFAVGATNHANGTMPTMEETTVGCYDAIWDDAAYNTVCAIPFIGNLAGNAADALGYTMHISSLYCWQAYHALGDGSILPYRVMPTPNDVSHLPTLPIGMDTYEINALPGSYVGITKDGVLYGAGMVDETGTLNLSIEPITSGGDVTICVTHPQHEPYIAVVPAAALDGAYMAYDSYEVMHTVNHGAYVPMNVTIKNVGSDAASNLTVTLSTESEYVEILNNEATVAGVDAGESFTIENVFDFDVAVNVPNNEKIQFFLTCTDGESTWESKFNIVASAPKFELVNITNTELTPGAEGTIEFAIANNGGADAAEAVFEVYTSSDELSLESNTFGLTNLAAGETFTLPVNLTVGSDVEIGATFEVNYLLTAGHYALEGSYIITVGNIIEGFETGDFSMYDWTFSGANWTIQQGDANSGNYCAKSGTIGHSSQTDLILTTEILANGEVSFYKKFSSENGWDKLFFYIDGSEMGNWSGNVDWGQETYSVTAGTHTFKWSYIKDSSVSSGDDCAWVDDIQFPPTSVTLSLDPISNLEAVVEDHTVTLTWDELAGASDYTLRRNGEEIATFTLNSYTETVNDGVYVYSVIAKDAQGHCSAPTKVTVDVGMVGVEENTEVLNVYPNPANSQLNLSVNADYQYSLFNNMGQEVLSGSANGRKQLNVEGLAKGIYVLRVTTGNQVNIQKVVID